MKTLVWQSARFLRENRMELEYAAAQPAAAGERHKMTSGRPTPGRRSPTREKRDDNRVKSRQYKCGKTDDEFALCCWLRGRSAPSTINCARKIDKRGSEECASFICKSSASSIPLSVVVLLQDNICLSAGNDSLNRVVRRCPTCLTLTNVWRKRELHSFMTMLPI